MKSADSVDSFKRRKVIQDNEVITQLQDAAAGAQSKLSNTQPSTAASPQPTRPLKTSRQRYAPSPLRRQLAAASVAQAAMRDMANAAPDQTSGSAPEIATTPRADLVPDLLNTPLARAHAGSYLCLHVAGKDGLAGLIEISHVATREELFERIREDLAIDISEADGMDIVRVERTDSPLFARFNERSIPIKQAGRHDLWAGLVKPMLDDGSVRDLKGYVAFEKNPQSRLSRG